MIGYSLPRRWPSVVKRALGVLFKDLCGLDQWLACLADMGLFLGKTVMKCMVLTLTEPFCSLVFL